jgi:hypothetical protein
MHMRRLALATVLGMIGLAGAAAAWTDPGGRMNLDAPRGWTVQPRQSDGATVVLAFTPSSDCYFYSVPNPTTASSTVRAARNTIAPLSAEAWVQTTQGVPDLFRAGTPTVVSQSVDTSGFWPVQRAQLQSGSNTVHAALQVRPGFELRGFCSGGEASYDAILNALSHPNDQAWQAQAEQEAATAAAAPAPAAEEPAPEQPQQRPRRGRGITSGPSSEQTGTGM